MEEGREALSVKKMKSESKVRRCGQGAERGAQAWGARHPSWCWKQIHTRPHLGT